MARGPSGRLVIEIDPALKRDLHAALAQDGLTLKDWFLQRASGYIAERRQPSLPGLTRYSEPVDSSRLVAEAPSASREKQ